MRFDEANAVQKACRQLGGIKPMAWVFARVLHRVDNPLLKRTGGKTSVTGLLTGLPIIEVTTTGARSGAPRTMPLVAVPDGDRLVVLASNFGQHQNPAWYYNLRAHPECTVTHAGESVPLVAYEATGDERERLWQLDLQTYPARAKYADRTGGRRIPVIVLSASGAD